MFQIQYNKPNRKRNKSAVSNPEDDEPLTKRSTERNEIDDIRKLFFFSVKSICSSTYFLHVQFTFSEDFLNDTNSTPIVNQSSNLEKSDTENPNDDSGAQDQAEQVPNSDLGPNLGPDKSKL